MNFLPFKQRNNEYPYAYSSTHLQWKRSKILFESLPPMLYELQNLPKMLISYSSARLSSNFHVDKSSIYKTFINNFHYLETNVKYHAFIDRHQ